MSPLEQYYAALPDGYRETLVAARQVLLGFSDLGLVERYKWRIPTFEYRGKHCAYLYHQPKTKKTYIAFPSGKFLQHPLLQADGRKLVRSLVLSPALDLPLEAIEDCLRQQISRLEELGRSYR